MAIGAPGELPAELLGHYVTKLTEGCRVADEARSWRAADRPELIVPIGTGEASLSL